MTLQVSTPTLTDGTVTIRAPRPEDAVGSYEQCLDPVSRQWTTVPLDYTYRDAQEYVGTRMPAAWEDDSEWGFVVEAVDEAGTPRFGGTISLRNHGTGRAEVAYGSHPWVRGHGIMERALRLLLRWGFEHRELHTVIWWANRGNWASRKVAWRLGFTFEGAPRRWLPQRGELRDAWVGTLLAGDPMEPRSHWLDVPRIDGEHVALRRLRSDDAARIVEGCLDPVTKRWLGQIPQPFTLAHAHEFMEDMEERHATGSAVTWAVADREGDRLVGLMNLFGIRPAIDAEVGYWMHPEARGRGWATEATRLALRHAFVPEEDGGLGLRRVRAVAAEENTASRRVLELAGLRLQGRERLLCKVEGGALADAAVYDVLVDELTR